MTEEQKQSGPKCPICGKGLVPVEMRVYLDQPGFQITTLECPDRCALTASGDKATPYPPPARGETEFELSLAETAAQHTLHLTVLLNKEEEAHLALQKLARDVASELRAYMISSTAAALDRLTRATVKLEAASVEK